MYCILHQNIKNIKTILSHLNLIIILDLNNLDLVAMQNYIFYNFFNPRSPKKYMGGVGETFHPV
jgi:hypothetical protein